jgi:MoxR-like ATPase
MKPSLIAQSLKLSYQIKQPCFIWGSPGIGKSQVVKQAADSAGLSVVDIRAVLLDPVDLRGLPTIKDGKSHWATPDFLPTKGEGVLFLDELNAAPPLVQAACYQLVLDRRLGEYELPPGYAVVAAGNRESDRAVTHRMPSALANRFLHLDFDIDLNDWVTWALKSGIETPVIAFLRFRPALLHDFDPKSNPKAFPTPRSWASVSKTLSQNPSKEIEFELYKGLVGEGAAAEFTGFIRIFRNLPNPDSIMLNPAAAVVPDDPATLYALCGALARKSSEQTFPRLVEYFNRLPAEFSVLAVRDSVQYCPAVTETRAFIEWASSNADILI